jgi:hypothetical protein
LQAPELTSCKLDCKLDCNLNLNKFDCKLCKSTALCKLGSTASSGLQARDCKLGCKLKMAVSSAEANEETAILTI